MRQLLYSNSLLIIMLHFTCDERKICPTVKNSQNIINMISSKFSFVSLSLLAALIVQNNHILAGIYFIFF